MEILAFKPFFTLSKAEILGETLCPSKTLTSKLCKMVAATAFILIKANSLPEQAHRPDPNTRKLFDPTCFPLSPPLRLKLPAVFPSYLRRPPHRVWAENYFGGFPDFVATRKYVFLSHISYDNRGYRKQPQASGDGFFLSTCRWCDNFWQ